jgi:DNA replication and repair protein RecF
MRIESLGLLNFKNYRSVEVNLSPGVNALVGPNGGGKSNLLDAIHVLSFTRSAFGMADALLPTYGSEGFRLRGKFLHDQSPTEVECLFRKEEGKQFSEGVNPFPKLRDYVGRYPSVIISPYDQELIWGGSEARRRFFDSLLAQTDRVYIDSLSRYNHLLRQRNLLLQQPGEPDPELVATYDSQLHPLAETIHRSRKALLSDFGRLATGIAARLGEPIDELAIGYRSDLEDGKWPQALTTNYARDRRLGRTTTGVHRDDYRFLLGGRDVKQFASQGQQKTVLLALKLGQFEFVSRVKGFRPILLLDDVFDRLDDRRMGRLIEVTAGTDQVFLTDARPERTRSLTASAGWEVTFFKVEGGTVRREN